MWIEEVFFKYMTGVILVLLTTLLLYYNLPIFYLILWFLAAIFLPVLFTTLFYYILRPAVNFLSQWLPRYLSILLVYLFVTVGVTTLALIFLPEFAEAINYFSSDKLGALKEHFANLVTKAKEYAPVNLPFFEKLFLENMPKINMYVYQFFVGFITAITGIAVAIGLTPFMLYYFLRDDSLFARFVLRFVPQKFQEEVQTIMNDIDVALSGFISAQATIALIIGCCLLIGYLIIGLPYPVSLAIFAMIFYIIPFIGTFLAIIPALFVAISISLSMMFKVVIIMLVAHLIEANLITPRLMASTLKIHPLTVILLLLIGGSLFGILGLILITPAYAIIKVFVWNIYKIIRLRYHLAKLQSIIDENTENTSATEQ